MERTSAHGNSPYIVVWGKNQLSGYYQFEYTPKYENMEVLSNISQPTPEEIMASNGPSPRTSFSIESLLGRGEDRLEDEKAEDEEIDVEDDTEDDEAGSILMPMLIRPTPRLPMMHHQQHSDMEDGKAFSEDEAAIAAAAAAVQSSFLYSQQPSNLLYSQWLVTRNANALFGLQGTHF
jgi:hypothetical protein